ncbi:MAG: hypothetical protein IJM15_06940, partial [Erysipelotrichaceae bacterium]|nr:hypothetical protein [Erysipelotrichaceae bacterium]
MNNSINVIRKLLEKCVLVVLCFSVVLASLSVTARAETVEGNSNYSASSSAPETMKIFDNDKVSEVDDEHIEYEIEEKREEFAKHFHLSDGSNAAVMYESPVFYYEEETGKYVEIDNSLSEEKDSFRNKNNERFSVVFDKDVAKGIQITDEIKNISISYKLLNTSEKTQISVEGDKEESILESKAVSELVEYKDVFKDTDVRYQIQSDGRIKENIILKSEEAPSVFHYSLEVKDAELVLEDNEIHLVRDGKIVYVIKAPFAMDDNGIYTDSVFLSIDDNNEMILTVDEEW